MAAGKCTGSMAEKWAKANVTRASQNTMIGPGHQLVLSAEVTWCLACGSYADAKAVGLTQQCKGVPKWCGSYGGAWGQRRKLLAGIHPKTRKAMDKAIGLDGRSIDRIMKGEGTYTNMARARSDRARGVEPPNGAEPEVPKKMQPQGMSAKEKIEKIRQRLRTRGKADATAETV